MSPPTWGYWTEQKLEMLGEYLPAFARASNRVSERIYLDLFAGDAKNTSRTTGAEIEGSPRIALRTQPEFTKVRLFELPGRAARLEAELQKDFPGRDLQVIPGDCNETIADALRALAPWNWAPTFALVDQYAAEVTWRTLQRLADFKHGRRTKVELWLLFADSMLPRALGGDDVVAIARYRERISNMFGVHDWLPAFEARRRGRLTGKQFREELANLMRWRLENELGYKVTHTFQMRNTGGTPLYRMIFASDHDVGDKIMHHIYGRAAERQPKMRAEAIAAQQARDEEESWMPGLFEPLPREMKSAELYQHEPPTTPYGLPEVEDPR